MHSFPTALVTISFLLKWLLVVYIVYSIGKADTDFFFCIHVVIHQVRIMDLDNYQRCPVPLKQLYETGVDFTNS